MPARKKPKFPTGIVSNVSNDAFAFGVHCVFTYFAAKGRILMEPQVEALQHMSETLESSGFSRKQSTAVVKSVARAMQTFSVTPEILETHFSKHRDEVSRMFSDHKGEMQIQFSDFKGEMQIQFSDFKGEMKQLFAEHKTDTNRRFDSVNKRFDSVDSRFDKVDKRFDSVEEELRDLRRDMHALQRSMTRFFWGFTLLVLGTALTALVALLAQ